MPWPLTCVTCVAVLKEGNLTAQVEANLQCLVCTKIKCPDGQKKDISGCGKQDVFSLTLSNLKPHFSLHNLRAGVEKRTTLNNSRAAPSHIFSQKFADRFALIKIIAFLQLQINCMLRIHVINLLPALLMTRLCPFEFFSWWSELLDRWKRPLCISQPGTFGGLTVKLEFVCFQQKTWIHYCQHSKVSASASY